MLMPYGIVLVESVGDMKQTSRGWLGLGSLIVLCAMVSACGNEISEQKGNGSMFFGLFGGKNAAKAATTVATELGSSLKAESVVPAQFAPPIQPSHPACKLSYYRGTPPDASWAQERVTGETLRAFVIPASAGQPPLAILAKGGAKNRLQVWELSDDKAARFVKQRQITLGADHASWNADFPIDVVCLPNQMVGLAVGYQAPHAQQAWFTYNPATNQFRQIERIEPEMSTAPPFKSFEVLAASPQAMLVLYHTEAIRLGTGNYVYQHDHVMLFSARHPQGLEILKLNLDDGNIRAWAMQGKQLWLQTEDRRKQAKSFNWSLDLSNVL